MITISQLTADLDRIKDAYGDLPIADSEGHLLPNLPPEVSALPPTGMCARLPFELTEVPNIGKIEKQLKSLLSAIQCIEIEGLDDAVCECESLLKSIK